VIRRNKLYLFLSSLCLVGYLWVGINFTQSLRGGSEVESVCLFKHITGIPCPSCGATRSVLSLLQGHFTEAVTTNPLGILLFILMLILPIWLAFDKIKERDGLFKFYKKTEELLRQKQWAIPAIILIMANWVWNIYKGL
jgi:glycyl-tRNA synthetase (class II)